MRNSETPHLLRRHTNVGFFPLLVAGSPNCHFRSSRWLDMSHGGIRDRSPFLSPFPLTLLFELPSLTTESHTYDLRKRMNCPAQFVDSEQGDLNGILLWTSCKEYPRRVQTPCQLYLSSLPGRACCISGFMEGGNRKGRRGRERGGHRLPYPCLVVFKRRIV